MNFVGDTDVMPDTMEFIKGRRELSPQEFRDALVGRTITGAAVHVDHADWSHDGDTLLRLDNGTFLWLQPGGYDASYMVPHVYSP
jgi:hypothetical protein